MRLVCHDLDLNLEFVENEITVLVVENPSLFMNVISRILREIEGYNAGLVLSDHEDIIPFHKYVDIIHSPFLIDINNKKMLTYLYKEMRDMSNEYLIEEWDNINSNIISYIDNIVTRLPYPIKFNIDSDLVSLFKLYGVEFDVNDDNLVDKLNTYVQLSKILCRIKLIVFVNIKSYLSKEQIEELYKLAFYNKIHLLLIESSEIACLSEEKYYIIDKDLCIITHD